MKTNLYMNMEAHRDNCLKIPNNKRELDACEGCLLVEEKNIPGLPNHKKRVCHPEKLERGDLNED